MTHKTRTTHTKLGMLSLLCITLLLSSLLAGCTPTPVDTGQGRYYEKTFFDPAEKLALKHFTSQASFDAFASQYSGREQYRTWGGEPVLFEAQMASADMTVSKAAPAPLTTDFSETNIQVEGVDEADILKTDGNYIYTVTGKTLYVIKAYPGEEAEVISTLELDYHPTGLFINGNNLALFGNFYDEDYFSRYYRPKNGMTYFNIYNMENKEKLKLVKEFKFEGSYFQARMIDDYIYYVTLNSVGKDIPPPVIMEGTTRRVMPVTDIAFFPMPYNNPNLATVHAVDLGKQSVTSKALVVEGNTNLYMSQNNLYLTSTENINDWEVRQEIMKDFVHPMLSEEDKAIIEKIKKADNDILSQQEKEQKIMQVINAYQDSLPRQKRDEIVDEVESRLKKKLETYEYFEYTLITRMQVDKDTIVVAANGKVPGHVLNQFSMDEHKSVFRIATSVSPRWNRFGGTGFAPEQGRTESTNAVFTLNNDLEVLDSITGIAEGESIFSTRFMGDKLYMVTFRQVDPFFVIDLHDPNDIKTLGELKIPGFSRYLHPYDETTIIGIGRDATDTGRTKGIKISLFDVSNVRNPKEIANFISEERYAQTSAEWEHKAFLFSKEKNLLVIPASNYAYDNDEQNYNGAMVFHITKDDIELRGIVDHSMLFSEGGRNRYGALVERSLYIEELLYTKSPNLLRINLLEDLSSVKNVKLEKKGKMKVY